MDNRFDTRDQSQRRSPQDKALTNPDEWITGCEPSSGYHADFLRSTKGSESVPSSVSPQATESIKETDEETGDGYGE